MATSTLNTLGPYRLLNVIHTGPASKLWQAYDDGNRRMVCIKSLLEKAIKDREQIGYLRQEYKVGRQVAHPRTIEMYSFDTHRGVPYLAMEWFPSPNLKKRIRAKEDWEKLAYLLPKIIEQAAEGLGCLHNFGWVDRDVKPDNFLVADDGQVKTLDFGLAIRAKHGLGRILAFRPKRQGTPSYMSPEQIRCAPLDERADVYSFGCVVYEMFAGNPPFTANSREELFTKHLKLPPPSLEAAAENVTPEFAQLVRSCMAKDPQSRPATAGDFLAEFRRVRVFKIQPRRPDRAGS